MLSVELKKRILSAIVLAALAGGLLFYTELQTFAIIVGLISFLAMREFSRALSIKGVALSPYAPYILNLLVLLTLWFYWQGPTQWAQAAAMILAAVWVVESFFSGKFRRAAAPWYIVGMLWISVPFSILVLLRFGSPMGANFIVHALAVAIASDAFAYFGGKAYGKTPLAKSISPNKTIEGSLTGLVVAMAVGHFLGLYLFGELFSLTQLALINLGIVVLGAMGDLIESKFKRFCGIKDMGHILPGHGGIMDRFDAYVTSLPFFWAVLIYLGLTGF